VVRFFKSFKSIPALFAFITITAYGLLLPITGFYWDDWPFAWIAEFLGPWEFFAAFTTIRPFLAPIFFITTSVIPTTPIHWQVFALIIRFISGLSIWFTLNRVFPLNKRRAIITSILFLVFPGYSQHWVALTHINQEWIPFIFYILSFGFTASALRQPDRFTRHTIFALLLLIAGVLPTEYFASLEPLRFLFIWVIVAEKASSIREKFIQSFKQWMPYLVIWLINAAWLVYFFEVWSYGSYDFEVIRQPFSITWLISQFTETLWKVGFFIWGQLILLTSQSITAPSTLLTLGLIGVAFVFFLLILPKLDDDRAGTSAFAIHALVIGIAGILLGRLPSLTAGLPLTLQSSYDRFMISMMIGGSMFIVGLTELLIKNSRLRSYMFAFLIALGIGQQFFNANIFRRDWARQQEIYWQLAWRIPAMEPGTALLTNELYVDYETDVSFTASINWMYAPDYDRSDNLPYSMIFTDIRLGQSLPALRNGHQIHVGFRTVEFQGSTSQMIVIHMPKNGCLRVLDPARGDQITYAGHAHDLAEAIPLSDPANIIVDSGQTAILPFLTEPEHTWCYHYARAELAFQEKNWQQVVYYIDEAVALGYEPEDPFEWLGYIEAKAITGDIESARIISDIAFEHDDSIRKGLCVVWRRISASIGVHGQVDQTLRDFQCVP
jgi:hypothetical protein